MQIIFSLIIIVLLLALSTPEIKRLLRKKPVDTLEQRLRAVLGKCSYRSKSSNTRGQEKIFAEHHVDALVNVLLPFIEEEIKK